MSGTPQQHWQQTLAAKQMHLASVAIYRAAGDRASLAKGLLILGSTFLVLGEIDEARIGMCQEL